MKAAFIRHAGGLVLLGALAIPAAAQQPAATPAPPPGPPVGEVAPDFEFAGITRYGALRDRQKLSDFRGSTVVLAFFPKARTRG
jgi:peroxiredoxin Q/BCP